MKAMRLKSGFAIFVIFFGLALLEAFRDRNLWMILFWLTIGTMFFVADNLRKHKQI